MEAVVLEGHVVIGDEMVVKGQRMCYNSIFRYVLW